MAHACQDSAAEGTITRRLREAKCVRKVPLRRTVKAGVVGGPRDQPEQG